MIRVLFRLVMFLLLTARHRSTPVDTTTADNGTTPDLPVELGDITTTADNPILDDPAEIERLTVVVNHTLARLPHGHHSIRIDGPDGAYMHLSATQAAELARDLSAVAVVVADIRQDVGANS